MAIWLSLCGAILVVAYLLGSFPTGYIAVKQLKGIDIREIGSGSTGATNVLRTLGKGPGAFVLIIDAFKGILAIFLAYGLFSFAPSQNLIPISLNTQLWESWMVILAGLAAILGHSKSIFLGFTGGKSVATSLGLLLAINWQIGLATAGVFAVVVAISRIVSLGSICGAIAVPIFMVLWHQPLPYILFAVTGGLYVILRHRSNLERMLVGTEPKLGQKVATATEATGVEESITSAS
jgi:acyl phosphate:glycerol-3-phosphate acyltransferase